MTVTEPSLEAANRPAPDVDLEALDHAAHGDYRRLRPASADADIRGRLVMPGRLPLSVANFDRVVIGILALSSVGLFWRNFL